MTELTDLDQLIRKLSPKLQEGEFVFCTFPGDVYGSFTHLHPVASFYEQEGLTLIIPKSYAEAAEITFDATYRQITLQVHSSLDAVGLTAAVSTVLANAGISANVVAAYFHDHIFVSSSNADKAMEQLLKLSSYKK